jgi:hypothetical protein
MNIKEAHKESDNRCSDTIGEQLQPQACRLNASSRLVQIVNQLNGIATKSDELAGDLKVLLACLPNELPLRAEAALYRLLDNVRIPEGRL